MWDTAALSRDHHWCRSRDSGIGDCPCGPTGVPVRWSLKKIYLCPASRPLVVYARVGLSLGSSGTLPAVLCEDNLWSIIVIGSKGSASGTRVCDDAPYVVHFLELWLSAEGHLCEMEEGPLSGLVTQVFLFSVTMKPTPIYRENRNQ